MEIDPPKLRLLELVDTCNGKLSADFDAKEGEALPPSPSLQWARIGYPYFSNERPNFFYFFFGAPHQILNPKIAYLDYHVITMYRKAIKTLGDII